MKILYLTSSMPYPPHTGGQIRSFFILKYLVAKGEVTLVTPANPETSAESVAALDPLCEKIVTIDAKRFGPNSKKGTKQSLKERLKKVFEMQSWYLKDYISEDFKLDLLALNPFQFDWIVIRYPQMAYYFLTDKVFKDLLGKIIIDIDDVSVIAREREVRQMPFGYRKLRTLLDIYFLKKYYRKMKNVKACFAVSEKDREYLLANGYANEVFVIPNMIEVRQEPPQPNPEHKDRKEILFCGMLSYPPNQKALYFFVNEIYPKIQSEMPDANFTIVGKNAPQDIVDLGKRKGIEFAGYVPSMEPYYEKADVIVVPLLNGAGTRIKILEAMSYGKAVVSTSVGAEGLDVQDSINIMIADEALHFAAKCIKLFQSAAKRETIARAGYNLVKSNYDIPVFNQKMDTFFNAITKGETCHALA